MSLIFIVALEQRENFATILIYGAYSNLFATILGMLIENCARTCSLLCIETFFLIIVYRDLETNSS